MEENAIYEILIDRRQKVTIFLANGHMIEDVYILGVDKNVIFINTPGSRCTRMVYKQCLSTIEFNSKIM